jgi:DNA-binding transcriptional regulator WhiA
MSKIKLFNEKSFDKISNKEAYFLGLLFSDGCLCKTTHGRYITCIGMNDRDVIENFKEFMKSKNKIYLSKTGKNKSKITYRISFCSQYLYKLLYSLGCVENKSLILKGPLIAKKYFLPFLLGVFDGDGSISVNRSINSWKVSIGTGSLSFSKWIEKVIKRTGIRVHYETRFVRRKKFFNLVLIGLSGRIFLKLLYGTAINFIPMKRKYEKFKIFDRVKLKCNPNLFTWELSYLKMNISPKECSEKIKNDKRTYGWVRSPDSIRHMRKYHNIKGI